MMVKDFSVVFQMYAIIAAGAAEALSLMKNGNVWEAMDWLESALLMSEEIYLSAEQAVDELEEFRKNRS